MNKAFKSIKQKWINTRFAKPYKQRLLWAGVRCAMHIAQAQCNISMIRSTRTDTAEQSLSKSLAIADTIVQSYSHVVQEFKGAKRC